MARLLRASRNAINVALSPNSSLLQQRSVSTIPKSPTDANVIRNLRNQIVHLSQLSPIREIASYKSFTIQDLPGEPWILMKRKFGDNEDISVKASIIDRYIFNRQGKPEGIHRDNEDISAKAASIIDRCVFNRRGKPEGIHINLIVEISKENHSDRLVFKCSVWPNDVEVDSVSLLRPETELLRPHIGDGIRESEGNFGSEADIDAFLSLGGKISKPYMGREIRRSEGNFGSEIDCANFQCPDRVLARPYKIHEWRKLMGKMESLYKEQKKGKFKTSFREYLETRGIDGELCAFLHQYMPTKGTVELVQWLGRIESHFYREDQHCQ